MVRQSIVFSTVMAAVAAIPAAGYAHSLAYSNAPPVSIQSCSVSGAYTSDVLFYGSSVQTEPGSLELTFINNERLPATTVKVVRKDGGHSQEIVDKGRFTAGVPIRHFFGADVDASAGNASCTVTEVDFVDGSAWYAAAHDVASR